MGGDTSGCEYCGNDGFNPVNGDNFAAFELWWDQYVVYLRGFGAGFANIVLY